ncbi:MAG: CBS domain-containing protein [Saprospiraceae bacterium]|nr:CBS domain-containing protein [Lewinella sp.]
MGDQKVNISTDQEELRQFTRSLLRDVQALEYMLKNDWFETDTIRMGAEQEMCLVDNRTRKPALLAMQVLEKMTDADWLTTELAQFNLETNLTPQEFTGSCFSIVEKEIQGNLKKIQKTLEKMNGDLVLTGILPTLRKFDLDVQNLTPKPRYRALIDAIHSQLIGEAFELRLMGIDEILVKHDTPLLEACNTSFQIHLQVTPDAFVQMYNIAQTLTAPIMAIAANSPIVFGRRLWHETRIALFQQALDVRTTHEHMRERSPRVSFGSGWLENSIMEIYKEDIARFRVLLHSETEEDSIEMIKSGKAPKLRALQVHNSTVYRWNRPCYGISPNGKPHLRIENRVVPSGPTVVDEVANAAFWLGAMTGMAMEYEDIRTTISWEDVRDNFAKAARYGIDTTFTWMKDKKISACDLVLEELLPLARKGLESKKVKKADIDKYLGIIEERAKRHMNGARWQLRAFSRLKKEVTLDEALTILTACIMKNQRENIPVHEWELPTTADLEEYRPVKLKVEEFMQTDLFTVQKDDIIELVAELMEWRKIRYMPVEDKKGKLSGLITSRSLMRYFNERSRFNGKEAVTVKDIMLHDPITIAPNATILEAMYLMRDKKLGCLPVVKDGELIGLITEMDFLRISGRLIERLEKE